jgi:uncharacterized delta-60 repeat protein
MFLTVLFAITSQVFASPITVSGTAYQGEGGTNIGFNKKVSLRVDGGGTFSDLTDFFGNYSITSVEVSPGSTITAWIDDDATYEGTTVTIANDPVGNISGLHIYGNRIIVRSDKTGTAVTNADLADYDEDNDPDIHFTCNSGNLVVDNDHELHIWTGDTFSPVGTVTTSPGGSLGGIHIGDSATFTAGGAISCGGSWTADTSSTFTPDGNAVIFTATAGGYSIITGGESFYDLTFNGPGGAWSFDDQATVTNDFTISAGRVIGPGQSFGTNGSAVYNSGGTQNDYGYDIAVDASGSSYVVGNQGTNGGDIVILKYDPSGALDTSWGGGDGIVTYNSGGTQADSGQSIALDSSGNVYVTGYQQTNGNDVVILKYDSTGALDVTWGGGDGIVIYNSGGTQNDYGHGITVDSSGYVYVAGYQQTNGNDIVVLKYDSMGALDTTWGSGHGVFTYNSGETQDDQAYSIAIDSSGNSYVTGSQPNGLFSDIVVLKLASNGGLDISWGGGDGVVTYDFGALDVGYGIVLDTSGNIYVSGRKTSGYDVVALKYKYDSTGAPDTSWGGGDGVVIYSSGGLDWGYGIDIDSSGNSYVVGYSSQSSPITGYATTVLKYNSFGELDPTWGDNGVASYYDSGSNYNYGRGVALDPSGNCYVVGYQQTNGYDIAVLKFNESGFLLVNGAGDNLTVGGDWTNSATFYHNDGSVLFNGAEAQQVTAGSSDWNQMEITNASAEGVTFADGFTCATLTNETAGSTLHFPANETVTISAGGGLTLTGTSGNLISLRRYGGSGSDQWTIYPQGGGWDVSYVDVQDSTNSHITYINPSGSTNSGNNTNWFTYTPDTVSGTVYFDEGTTPMTGAARTVSLTVNGGAYDYTTTTNPVDGTFSFPTVPVSAGEVFTLFIDDETEKAVTVTRSAGTSISGIDLYQNRVIVRHEDGGPVTNADLGQYDKDDDSDIHFTSNSGNLTVDNDHELHIWTGDTFSPGGGVTTSPGGASPGGDVHIDDNASFVAGGAISCGGSWTADTGAAFIHSNGTVTFSGTGVQTVTSGDSAWYNIVITNASAGGVSFADGFTCGTFINTTAGSTLYFAASETVTITAYEGLVLTGAEGNLISLRRYGGSELDQWNINALGTGWSVSYVDVQDANDIHEFYINPSNSTDSGNNTNWFTPTVSYTLTMADDGYGSTTPSAGPYVHPAGTIVDIDATPVEHYQFDNWTGSGVTDPDSASTTVLVDANETVTANFSQIMYTLTMAVSGSGSTTPTAGDHVYGSGTVVDITAVPQEPNLFLGWSGSGVADPAAESTTVVVDGDKIVTAKFGIPGASLEVPIEMIDQGISSQTSQVEHTRSAVRLNEADYDGATEDYYFEVVAENLDISDRYVYLKDVTHGSTKASRLVPGNTLDKTRLRIPFMPASGNNEYRIIVEGTSSDNQLRIFAARIIVVQEDAYNTRIQIPLLNHSHSGYSNATDVGSDNISSTSYSQEDEFRFSIWKKNISAWGDIAAGSPWTFEAVLRSTNASGTASVSLFSKTDGAEVAATQLTTSSTTHTLKTVDFATSAADFDDLEEFEVRHKISNGAYISRLARACLYVKLTDLNKGEVYWRFTRKASASGSDYTHGCQRVLLNTDNYSGAKVYHGATGAGSLMSSITTNVWDAGTSDSITDGTVVPGSGIAGNDFNGIMFDRGRARKGPLNVTSGNRYIHSITPWIGFVDVASGWLVVGFEARKVSGTVYSGEGVNPLTGTSKTVRLQVNGLGDYSAETNPDNGTYSIPKVIMGPGSVITLFLDDEAQKAVTVTRAAGPDNIPGLDLYQNRVVVRHDDAGPINNNNLGEYDADDDSDIHFTSNDGALTVDNDHGLYIWKNSAFSPGGLVTALSGGPSPGGDIHVDDNASFEAGEAISCGGSWTVDTGATFAHNSYGVTLNATTAGKVISTNGQAFYDLTFDGAGGGWTFQDDLIVANDFTISSGAVIGPAGGTITVGGNWSNSDTFSHNDTTVIFDGTGAQEVTTGGSDWNAVEIANVNGSVAFADGFTCATFTDVTAGSTLSFATGETFVITSSGGLTLTGAEGNLITLMGYGDPGQWNMDPQGGGWDVSYVDVSDSANLHALSIAAFDSTDSGNNTNWFEARPVYLRVTGSDTQTAGGGQQITITAYDQYDVVAPGYTGDATLTFSGASSSPSPPTVPTCSDKSGVDIAFGSPTLVTFANGVGTSTMKLYKDEEVQIDVSDGFLDSTSYESYDLDITISPAAKNKLLWVTQPSSPVGVDDPWPTFTIEISDQYGNRTSDTDTITVSPSAGSLDGTSDQAALSGLATFDDIRYGLHATISLTGAAGGLVSTPLSNDVVVLGHIISGSVGTVEGVTLNGLPGDPVTGPGGSYSARVDHGWSGTVTPTKDGYTFDPANWVYSGVGSDQLGQDYTPTIDTNRIYGYVGTLDGVTMSGFPGDPVITSGGGYYNKRVDYGWSGTITPVMVGYTFAPPSITYDNVIENQTNQNYTPIINTYTISGHVGTLDGVVMSGLPGNPVTSAGGFYSGTVEHGWSGTVTPTKDGPTTYTFDPASKNYSNVTSGLTDQDYTPSIGGYTLTMQTAVSGIGSTTPAVGDHVYPKEEPPTSASIEAVSPEGWQFVNWTGDGVTDPNSAVSTVIIDGNKTVIANFSNTDGTLDVPHYAHRTSPRGPEVGDDCTHCHDIGAVPAHDNVNWDACDTCHSPGGVFNGVNDAQFGAIANWKNSDSVAGGNPATADESLIYESDGTLKAGKDKWCAACHDHETGTSLIDDFSSYATTEELQVEWKKGSDVVDRTIYYGTTASSMQPWEHGNAMTVSLDWSNSPTVGWGRVKRSFDPPIDLSDRTHFNFYLKLDDRTEVASVVVGLQKPDDIICSASVATGSGNGFKNEIWHLVSVPRSAFDITDWGEVKLIRFTIKEQSADQMGTTTVWFDEIGCDVTGPDVVRNDVDSGYYKTGHKMYCFRCHDTTGDHIDNNRAPFLEYIDTTNNPTDFRFYDDPDMQMELPYSGGYTTEQFALCYQCHEESWIMEDASALDYDPNDLNTNFNSSGWSQHNLHRYHITGWGATCVLCHDPHGQWNPAMNRIEAGDLVYAYGDGDTIENRQVDTRPANGVPDWYDSEANMRGRLVGYFDSNLCTACHPGAYMEYYRIYKRISHGGPCGDCHAPHNLNQSHGTHTQANTKGPEVLDCSHCHGLGFDSNRCEDCHGSDGQVISDIDDMVTLAACDNCHSPGGQDGFDGVQMGKANWNLGAYEGGLLKSGSEKWCASCHDDDPASSNPDGSGEMAPTMTGNNNTYGYYVTGHGLNDEDEYDLMCFQEGSGNGNPGAEVICDQCHDSSSDHIVEGNVTRLKPGFENDDDNSNCNQCHPPGTDATSPPELYTNSPEYETAGHGGLKCTGCHEVHGLLGAYPAMTGGDCRDCISCHNGEGIEPHPTAPVLPTIVPAHDGEALDSCSSGCHNPHIPAHGGGEPDCFSAGCHVVGEMHAAHFASDPGPGLPPDETGCNECHAGGDQQCQISPWFWDNKSFADTLVCGFVCHIPRDLEP